MNAPRPHQVIVYVGSTPPDIDGARIIDATPADTTTEAVLAALTATGLNPSDLRSRVLFVADGNTPEEQAKAVLMYAAFIGFAKRRLDFAPTAAAAAVDMTAIDQAVRKQTTAGKPETPPDIAQVGGRRRDDITWIDMATAITPDAQQAIKFARHLRFVPDSDMLTALLKLVTVAAIRSRGPAERLPQLCNGTEPAEDGVDCGTDLGTIYREADGLRRQLRTDERGAIAEAGEPNARLLRLREANAVPLRDVLARLGSTSKLVQVAPRPGTPEAEAGTTVEVEMWHCPRPDRHTNGDATPSSRITGDDTEQFRCFRCDAERVQPLRLVMDVNGGTVDEAADWLLAA